ncbi:uncharacterized protein K460DRAFT_110081 [Cucurbitaria berberidis CBS 394.84]|uniref:Uncharacterized protein n=1 Tax=Cucurbitaria berberidis CBS 394.84 TaxID=1168544 RepID=A0A9P4GHX8_9PLEO|nr:uncharacterized protein K460DRAFT_110081 [Cucurbitaria berberidis CBS 394.84]KAF1845501.1 hypothetical protein K460DRAFT_110081 [Cucurbitaria berberidis CBS 394.84]
MLRLRPSELTLTPEHVDESFRRIAHRHSSRATTVAPSRASAHPGRPILRRGPQRSTQDAITALGDIPILRPSSQQAVYTSVEEDIDHSHHSQVEEAPIGTSPPASNGQAVSALTAASLALRSMHIPFRLTRYHQASHTASTPDEPAPTDASNHATPGPAGTSSPVNMSERTSQPRLEFSPNSPAELRGGGGPRRNRAPASPERPRAPSLSQQGQRPSSPGTQERSQNAVDAEQGPNERHPTIYLQGFFTDPNITPGGVSYDFEELHPRTEPPRRSSRQPMLTRSFSSGSAPTFALPQRPDASRLSTDHGYSIIPAPQPPMRPPTHFPGIFNTHNHASSLPSINNVYRYVFQADQVNAGSRQPSSESSGASAAFSYYGSDLPASRNSSSTQSAPDQVAQYDGAVPSRHVSHAAHNPPRPLEIGDRFPPPRPLEIGDPFLRPLSRRGSSRSSPNLALSVQHGISPLPSMPYTRGQGVQSSPQPPPGLVNSVVTGGNPMDAATAAAQDLRSPLDDYSEQYQRSLQARLAAQRTHAQSRSYPGQLDGLNTYMPRQGIGSRPYGTVQDPYGPMSTGYRQPQPPVLRSTLGSSEHVPYPPIRMSQSYDRSSQPIRPNPFDEAPSSLHWQGQPLRAAHGHQSSVQAIQGMNARHSQGPLPGPTQFSSIPQEVVPRDISNRPRTQQPQPPHHFASRVSPRPPNGDWTSVPLPITQPRRPSQGHVPSEHREPRLSPEVPRRFLPQRGSFSLQPDERPPRNTTRSRRRPSTLNLQPTLDSPLTSVALDHGSGTTSRRPRSLLPRTRSVRPRLAIPARQQDQENSGEGEMALMRREEGAINSRYGEEEQRDVMDETPPRVGRVERRMFE